MDPFVTDQPGHAGRVLVVDDTAANRELMTQELEDEGFEIEQADSGEACLRVAAAWHPEVILLDFHMPGLDGIEVCRRLKQSPETKHIPVLFVTAERAEEEAVVEALSAGGNDFLPKPYSPAILVARVSSQVAISRAHAQLRRMAMIDELTGVFSRRHLFSTMARMVKSAARGGPNAMGCLVIDVDHFKQVNDRLGHIEGDRVLRGVAQAIVSATRDTDVVARFGGEEFVALLPATDEAGARVVAEKVRSTVAQQCAPVTVSVGLACQAFSLFEKGGPRTDNEDIEKTMQAILQRADRAVYQAKSEGRDRVVVSPGSPA